MVHSMCQPACMHTSAFLNITVPPSVPNAMALQASRLLHGRPAEQIQDREWFDDMRQVGHDFLRRRSFVRQAQHLQDKMSNNISQTSPVASTVTYPCGARVHASIPAMTLLACAHHQHPSAHRVLTACVCNCGKQQGERLTACPEKPRKKRCTRARHRIGQ